MIITAHTPPPIGNDIPTTVYHTIQRPKVGSTTFTFRKLPNVAEGYGDLKRSPHQFIATLKNFPPNIDDMVIVASTVSEDTGIFTRSKAPLAQIKDGSAEDITNVFTSTGLANDAMRAQMSMTEDLESTSPIGVALDLSSKDPVPAPVSEVDESSTPLPALMILNDEGVLAAWWIIYSDSIRQGTAYSGLVAITGVPQSQPQQAQQQSQLSSVGASPKTATTAQAFDQSSFGTLSGKPAPSAWRSSTTPAFGSPSPMGSNLGGFKTSSGPSAPAFGSPSPLRNSSAGFSTSSGTSVPAFGKHALGSPSPLGGGPAFGATGGLGPKQSVWGTPASGASKISTPAFGQPSQIGMSGPNPDSTYSSPALASTSGASTLGGGSGGSGFAAFAKNTGGFTSVTPSGGSSSFAQTSSSSPFGAIGQKQSIFGGPQYNSKPATESPFAKSSPFVLGSTFKADHTTRDDTQEPAKESNKPLFSSSFGSMLGEVSNAPAVLETKEATMESDSEEARSNKSSPQIRPQTTTPTDTPVPPKFSYTPTVPPIRAGLFGTQAQAEKPLAAIQTSTPASNDREQLMPEAQAPETPENVPLIKAEPEDTPNGISKDIPKYHVEKPQIPPEILPKESKTPIADKPSGDDAPLPPDFTIRPTKKEPVPDFQPPLPNNGDQGLDDEGSGVDVADELSDSNPRITPESSFATYDRSPSIGGSFAQIGHNQGRQPSKLVFGQAPFFPPQNRLQESPRSPSPIRPPYPNDSMRPENSRSISAPNVPPKSPKFLKPGFPPLSPTTDRPQRFAAERHKKKAEDFDIEKALDADDEEDLSEQAGRHRRDVSVEGFIGRGDFEGAIGKTGTPARIMEAYRDISSMIESFNFSAQNLAAFTAGNDRTKPGGRSLKDLDIDEDWYLAEIPELEKLEDELLAKLHESGLGDAQGLVNSCAEIQQELDSTRIDMQKLKRAIERKTDPNYIEQLQAAPLNSEQTVQLKDLRTAESSLKKLLKRAEDVVGILKAKLVSLESVNGENENGTKSSTIPSLDAVEKTVRKMTNMAEKRNRDIEALEAQVQKLRFPSEMSPTIMSRSISRDSGEGSAFVTPPSSFRKSKGMAVFQTPRSEPFSNGTSYHTPWTGRSIFGGSVSVGSSGTSRRRRRIDDVDPAMVDRYREKMLARSAKKDLAKEALLRGAPRKIALEDD